MLKLELYGLQQPSFLWYSLKSEHMLGGGVTDGQKVQLFSDWLWEKQQDTNENVKKK